MQNNYQYTSANPQHGNKIIIRKNKIRANEVKLQFRITWKAYRFKQLFAMKLFRKRTGISSKNLQFSLVGKQFFYI